MGDMTADAPAELLPGVLVGHDTDPHRPTGVTVVVLPENATTGVDVRGAAPGTRETDLLDPVNTIQAADAIVLAGGSAFGLSAATGVMRWLEEHGRGVPVGPVRVPIVPAAVVFDLFVGDTSVRPDESHGYRACTAAVPLGVAAQGSVGAGAGATVGKLLGPQLAMRGGLGIASLTAAGVTMAAVVVVNAVGDVIDPADGTLLAGARGASDSAEPVGAIRTLLGWGPGTRATRAAESEPQSHGTEQVAQPGGATTIGVLVTDARLTKAQATRLAQVAHDGLARTIVPVHTPSDGDALFVAGTGTAAAPDADLTLLSMLAAEVTARAVVRAIRAAEGLHLPEMWLPAWRDRATTARPSTPG